MFSILAEKRSDIIQYTSFNFHIYNSKLKTIYTRFRTLLFRTYKIILAINKSKLLKLFVFKKKLFCINF